MGSDKLDLSEQQIRRLRLRAQRFFRPGAGVVDTPLGVLDHLCAAQAQDLPAGRLSLRARGDSLTETQIETARLVDYSIAWTWTLRGTLHLVKAEDACWLVPFLGPRLIRGDQKRLFDLGWDETSAANGLRLLKEALDEDGQLSRTQIIQLLKDNDLPWQGQAPVHLIFRAAYQCDLLRGPYKGREETYVPFTDWLGEPESLTPSQALERLARRYLAAYAPATPQDLSKWAAISLSEARQAFELIQGETVRVSLAGHCERIVRSDLNTTDQLAVLLQSQLAWLDEIENMPPVLRLLPRFDTYLLGYASRDMVLEPAYAPRVFLGGIVKPVLLADGRISGSWNLTRAKNRLEISIEPFEPFDPTLLPLIEAEAQDVGRFLGYEKVEIRV